MSLEDSDVDVQMDIDNITYIANVWMRMNAVAHLYVEQLPVKIPSVHSNVTVQMVICSVHCILFAYRYELIERLYINQL